MSDQSKPTLLVTGASGHLGRRVIELLLESETGTIIAATRKPERLADLRSRGVVVRYADFDDPASLVEAFAGVNRLLLISTDAFGRRLTQHRAAVKAAEDAGVDHVIYTSIVRPDADSPVAVVPDHRGTEEALASSKLGWTVLRNNIYADMLLMALQEAVQMGQLFSAAGAGKTAYVTREDCARAAAAALKSTFTGRRALDVTGPEALSQVDLAAIATTITGRSVTYVPVEADGMIQNLVTVGLSRVAAEMFVSFDVGIAQNRFSVVSDVVEQLTGHSPQGIADFLAAHREALLAAEAAH